MVSSLNRLVNFNSEIIIAHIGNKKVEVGETFSTFFPIARKKAVKVTQEILNIINEVGLDINLFRS